MQYPGAVTEARVVLMTVSSEAEGLKVARGLVERKLAACVNVVPGVRSIYRWKGAVQDDRELLLVAKTRAELVDALVAAVKELHSYTVPEVVALPVLAGNPAYLEWVKEETT